MSKITDLDCAQMYALRRSGMAPKELAQMYDVSVGTVYDHTNGKCSHDGWWHE